MIQDLKAAKKPYNAPALRALDAGAAKAELEAMGTKQDANAGQILTSINRRLDEQKSAALSELRIPLT